MIGMERKKPNKWNHASNGTNKRPKGPHIVHLSTMCHLLCRNLPRRTFLFTDRPEKQKLGRGC